MKIGMNVKFPISETGMTVNGKTLDALVEYAEER